MNTQLLQVLLDDGFNIMPIGKNKTPLFSWKNYQEQKILNLEQFNEPKAEHYALICGFNDVECIDVDLKVLTDKKDRDSFFNELISMLSDHIDDFNKRFVIKKTINHGYHILYRAKSIAGNKKLATLTGCNEAIIETRGVGGYVCMYPEINQMDYRNIQLISDDERNIVIGICKSFNEVHEEEIKPDYKVEKNYKPTVETITPWDDYNNKVNILDVVGSEFKVVKDTHKKIMLKRHGAKSPHSGYIYKDSGCMFLFSTGTQYPNETLISAYAAFTIKDHGGDFHRSASYLYSQGYGDRRKPTLPPSIKIEKPELPKGVVFPIDIFPEEITHYINECNRTLQNSVDYMGCGFLWIASLIIGNTLRIEVKKGWEEISTIWCAIVGGAGIGKSPSINSVIRPLQKINAEERKRYQRDKQAYDEYSSLSNKEKECVPHMEEPQRTQFIVDDVTIEALINLHAQNPNGVGVFKDELAGWFKDMNKYKEGSDKEQWLSSWSGQGIAVDRITRQSDYISKPILPVLGGIQPSILSGFFTDDNKESGFLDRMLFAFPDLSIEKYIDEEISEELITYYDEWVVMMYKELRKLVCFDDYGDVKPNICKWSAEAKPEWIRIFNDITTKQNSDDTNELTKPMLAKIKSYIPRFALILNTIDVMHLGEPMLTIKKKAILSAEKLAYYFIDMNNKMLISNLAASDVQGVTRNKSLSVVDKIRKLLEEDPKFNKATAAKELNVSRKTIYKYIKQIKDEA